MPFRGPRAPTLVIAGAGSSPAENGARVGGGPGRAARRRAGRNTATRTFGTSALPARIGPGLPPAQPRWGALGYPTVRYVARATTCHAAGDASTVDAVRGALAGGAAPSAIVVGAAVVRHGACGEGFGNPAFAWWNKPVDMAVRIDVTARAFR